MVDSMRFENTFLKIFILTALTKSNMAEFEYTTDDVVDDVDTSYEDDTQEDNETELTVEDYQKEKARRQKAERTLVELKKQLKSKSSETTPNTITEEELVLREEISEFLSENKDLKEYKADLMKYAKKMLSEWDSMKTAIRKAKALVENDDKTIENRRKTQSMNISEWENAWKTVYTYDELERMSQSEYNKIKALQLKWQVKFK